MEFDFKTGKEINREKKYIVARVVAEDGKEYFIFSDANIYTRENNKYKILDNFSEESKKIIKKIKSEFKGGKTDVIKEDIKER